MYQIKRFIDMEQSPFVYVFAFINLVCVQSVIQLMNLGGGGPLPITNGGVPCAILTKKVVPKSPGSYLKLRPKNPGIRNARLSFYVRKFTTQR